MPEILSIPVSSTQKASVASDEHPSDESHLDNHTLHIRAIIALFALAGIVAHLLLRMQWGDDLKSDLPLLGVLLIGGAPLLLDLGKRLVHMQFGSDLLAGISIVTSLLLHQYLAGSLVVLMLAGGESLEAYALTNASSVLRALSKRIPRQVHLRSGNQFVDIPIEVLRPQEMIELLPYEICPADSTVVEGEGTVDESFLTGEPYHVKKVPGCTVLSGAINGQSALALKVQRAASDSRYASITRVMRDAEQRRPRMRRLADRLGAWYTPAAVAIALLAWAVSGEPQRFLAVLVVATPCPLLIAIPVAIVGTISLAARRGIIIRDPAMLERLDTCRTVFFDKTGTLTYGRPRLEETLVDPDYDEDELVGLAASLEQYSRHPLAQAVVRAARDRVAPLSPVSAVHEPPGHGLSGVIRGKRIMITGRSKVGPFIAERLPPIKSGLECIVLVDGNYAATFCFRDEPRPEISSFVSHLRPQHQIVRTVLLTGDRQEEAARMAKAAGINEVFAGQSPEQKLAIVREATKERATLYLGDGVNDAPAMLGATVAIAFGSACDVTSEAAGAVILEPSLRKLDELLHISRRLRHIALTSALGGMGLSFVAVGFATAGWLPPVAGAVFQEIIDLAAVLNALRATWAPKFLSDIPPVVGRTVRMTGDRPQLCG